MYVCHRQACGCPQAFPAILQRQGGERAEPYGIRTNHCARFERFFREILGECQVERPAGACRESPFKYAGGGQGLQEITVIHRLLVFRIGIRISVPRPAEGSSDPVMPRRQTPCRFIGYDGRQVFVPYPLGRVQDIQDDRARDPALGTGIARRGPQDASLMRITLKAQQGFECRDIASLPTEVDPLPGQAIISERIVPVALEVRPTGGNHPSVSKFAVEANCRFQGAERSVHHPGGQAGCLPSKVGGFCGKGYDAAGRKCSCGFEYPVGGYGFHQDISGVVEVESGKVYASVLCIVHQHPVHADRGVVGTEPTDGNGLHASDPTVILHVQTRQGTQHLVQFPCTGTFYG